MIMCFINIFNSFNQNVEMSMQWNWNIAKAEPYYCILDISENAEQFVQELEVPAVLPGGRQTRSLRQQAGDSLARHGGR